MSVLLCPAASFLSTGADVDVHPAIFLPVLFTHCLWYSLNTPAILPSFASLTNAYCLRQLKPV